MSSIPHADGKITFGGVERTGIGFSMIHPAFRSRSTSNAHLMCFLIEMRDESCFPSMMTQSLTQTSLQDRQALKNEIE
jgi:hypothetical protein